MKLYLIILFAVSAQACANSHCRYVREADAAKKTDAGPPVASPEAPVANIKTSSADRVRIYKFDGSLQCGLGHSQSLSQSQKTLASIRVYQSWKRHDGMMRVQLCGSPTGQANVFEIDRKDLPAAIQLGFKEWTVD